MPLSEFTVRHARTTGKNYTLGDFDGLSLWVTKAGGKLWLFRYYWEARQQRMPFGSYSELSLKQRVNAVMKRASSPRRISILRAF
jgi:hypothetical protein